MNKRNMLVSNVGGTGVSTRVAIYDSSGSITSNANLTYTSSGLKISYVSPGVSCLQLDNAGSSDSLLAFSVSNSVRWDLILYNSGQDLVFYGSGERWALQRSAGAFYPWFTNTVDIGLTNRVVRAVYSTSFIPTTRQTYTVTGTVADRAFAADTVLEAELGQVVATLITDLKAIGLIL